VQRNILAVITLVSLVAALISVLTIEGLTPLKSVEPFVIQVEDKTGITKVVKPLKSDELLANESLNNFFVLKYVKARETYIHTDQAEQQYLEDVVRLMSDRKEFAQYQRQINPNIEGTVPNRLGNLGNRRINKRAISYIDERKNGGTARVEILVTEMIKNDIRRYNKVAIVQFEYADLNLTEQERDINPLGFVVVAYRLDDLVG
jgi:type IV secretion system protein VirB8